MNCQQFTALIIEVARGQMLDAAARDGAMRHAESCQACAARLAHEQSLTNALRAVALDMKDHSGAPARVEAKLLAAFQQSLAPATARTTTAAPASLPTSIATETPASNRQARRAVVVTMAIAASLVLLVLATLYKGFMPTAPTEEIVSHRQPQASGERARVNQSPNSMPPTLATSGNSTRQTEGESPRLKQHRESKRTAFKLARVATPRMLRSRQVIDGGNAIIEASEGETPVNGAGEAALRPNEAESVTEFISLVAGAPAATPLEGGQLVRVQLPRSALASLGLPLNVERENESVRADVLLGNDGLARAIRFVR